MTRYAVKKSTLHENSYNVIDTTRTNRFGEPFVRDCALTHEEARRTCDELNAPQVAKARIVTRYWVARMGATMDGFRVAGPWQTGDVEGFSASQEGGEIEIAIRRLRAENPTCKFRVECETLEISD